VTGLLPLDPDRFDSDIITPLVQWRDPRGLTLHFQPPAEGIVYYAFSIR